MTRTMGSSRSRIVVSRRVRRSEHTSPLVERQIGGDNDRAALVTLAHPVDLNDKPHPSVKPHALHPPAPVAFRQRPSAAGFLLRRYRSARRFSEGSLLRRLQSSRAAVASLRVGLP